MRDHLKPCQKPSYQRFLSTRDADVVDSSAPESPRLSKREMAKARAVMHASNVLHHRSQDGRAVFLMLAGSHRAFAVATSPRRLSIYRTTEHQRRTPGRPSLRVLLVLACSVAARLPFKLPPLRDPSLQQRLINGKRLRLSRRRAQKSDTRWLKRSTMSASFTVTTSLSSRLPPNTLLLNESGWSFATVDLVVTREKYGLN